MDKLIKLKNLLFIFSISFLALLFFSFYISHSATESLIATLITWSFYILCIPAFHGKIIIGFPYKFITGKKLLYPEKFIWPTALLFNLIMLISYRPIYSTTIITHFFLQILLNPWPQWLIIFVAAIGTFYKAIVGSNNFYTNKILHYSIRTILVISGIFTLIYFSYDELIILLNVMV